MSQSAFPGSMVLIVGDPSFTPFVKGGVFRFPQQESIEFIQNPHPSQKA
jgi:hypothetical protein